MVQRAHAAAGKSGPYTVADAMEDYFRFAEGEGRGVHTIRDARYRAKAIAIAVGTLITVAPVLGLVANCAFQLF